METAYRTRLAAAAAALGIGMVVLGQAWPSAAAPPAGGTEATGLIAIASGGATNVQLRVDCPPSPQSASGAPSAGSVTVAGETVACTATSATASGSGATAGSVVFGAFSATCGTDGTTSGSVTAVSGIPAGTYTTTQTFAAPNGATVILNEVTASGGFVTRTAIHLIASDGAQAFIGQVVCASAYPLAVDAAGSAPAAARPVPARDGGSDGGLRLVGSVAAVLLVAQVAAGVWMRRRRAV